MCYPKWWNVFSFACLDFHDEWNLVLDGFKQKIVRNLIKVNEMYATSEEYI